MRKHCEHMYYRDGTPTETFQRTIEATCAAYEEQSDRNASIQRMYTGRACGAFILECMLIGQGTTAFIDPLSTYGPVKITIIRPTDDC